MDKVKYIVTNRSQIIVFSPYYTHKEMARGHEIISAGFIGFFYDKENKEVDCVIYGRSESLGLDSRPVEDREIARKQILQFL